MNNRANPNQPIFPSLTAPWSGFIPGTHSVLSPPPRFPYSVDGSRAHQSYVPSGVLRGPEAFGGYARSPSPSLYSRSSFDYSSSERDRRLSPPVPRHRPQDDVINSDPVVFNAGFTFRMGKETRVHNHVEARAANTVPEAQSSNLTRQIDKFLKKTDHMLDRYSAVVESRSATSLAKRRGKSATPGRGLDDSPDLSMSLSYRAQRSTSAAAIAVKAEKHFEALNRIGNSTSKKAAPIAEHEDDDDLESSSSDSFDELDTDDDVPPTTDVFSISDDTSADLSKLSAIEADGERERSASLDPSRLDDLSSDSDDEYFDVVAVPGLRPHLLAAQSPTKSSTPHQLQQPVQSPHIPPTHSRSLPAVNKGNVVHRMGSTPAQPVGTVVVNKPSETIAAASNTVQALSALPKALIPTNLVDAKLTNSSVKQAVSTAQASESSEKGSTAYTTSKVDDITKKVNSPKKYQAPQPPPITEQLANTQHSILSDKQGSSHLNKMYSVTTDMQKQILSNRQSKTLIGKHQASLPDRKPPDKLESNKDLAVNITLNERSVKQEKTESGSSPQMPLNKNILSGTNKTASMQMQQPVADKTLFLSAVGHKIRAGSPVPDNTAVMGVKLSPAVLTGKLEIAASDGSTIVRKNSTSEKKTAIDDKVNSSSEILGPKDSITLNNKSAIESNQVTKKQSLIAGDEINESTLKENENKLTSRLIATSKTKKVNMKNDKTDAELQRESVFVSKERENVVNQIQIGNTINKENPKETEAYIERSSRCSSVASDASRAVSPDGSLRSGAKRSRSGKLASVLNMWESDEISQKSEKGKSKSTSTTKIGKITGLASVFEGEKSAGTSSSSKNIITKLKSPYSPPFSPERKPPEEKITNIAGISTAKFGNVSKFKRPGEPKIKLDTKSEASNADKKNGININAVKESDLGKDNAISKNKVDEKANLNNKTVSNSTGKGCEDKIANGDVMLTDSSTSVEDDEGKENKIKNKKVKVSTSSNNLAGKSATDTKPDNKLLDGSATEGNSAIVKATDLKAVRTEAVESNAKVKATEYKDTKRDASESINTKVKTSESKDIKAKTSESKDTKAKTSESKDTKAKTSESMDTKAKTSESKNIKARVSESKDTKAEVSESKDTKAKTSESKDTKAKTSESKDTKAEVNGSKDTKAEVGEFKATKAEVSESKDTKAKISDSKDTKAKTSESKDTKAEVSESKDTKSEVSESKDIKAKTSESKDIKVEVSESKATKAENIESGVKKVDNASQQNIVKSLEPKVATINKDIESKTIRVKTVEDEAANLEAKVKATDLKITTAEIADAQATSDSSATTDMVTNVTSAEIPNAASTNAIKATQVNESRNLASDAQVIKSETTSSIVVEKIGAHYVCNTETRVDAKTRNTECTDLEKTTVLLNDDHLKCNISHSSSPILNAHIASDTGATGKENEALKTPESVCEKEGAKKDVFGGIKSFIESVAKGGKTLEDKLSINGLQFSKKPPSKENMKDMDLNHKEILNNKTGISSENSEQFERQTSLAMSLLNTLEPNAAPQDNSRKTVEGRLSLEEAIHKTAKALPQLESEVEALIREASVLIAQNQVITKSSTSGTLKTSITQDEKQAKIGKSCSTSVGEEGEEEVYVDAIDPSQLDTLMPLPDMEIEREWRSRSRTPLEGPERSPSTRSVVAKTEALLSETDRLLRRSRSDKSLRRSYSRSMSAAALNKLAEVTADLSEEHGTAHLAGERLEAEQAERMKLEKEVERLQTDMRLMTTANGKLEMEKQVLQSEVLSVADFNGDADHDYDEAAEASLYKRKYEWCLREIDLLKKQLKQQQEDDLDHLLLMKKQLEKKVSDAYEETEEQRQVVAQMKRKSQRLQAELNDLKMLLEEQASRNNLLEKKQRKFDQDMMGAQEELRHERANKEKIQRERDQILSEKYSFEQEVSTLKLELELKDEKISSLSRELEDLSFTGKVEEEVATLKKAKHDLELRVKDQEEELDDLAGQVQMLEGAKVRLEMSIEQMRKENRREVSQREEELEEVRISAQKKVKALEAQLENEHEERTLLVREKHEQERRINELQDRTITHVDEDYIHKLKKELKKTKALLRDTQTMLEKSQSEGGHKLLVRQLKTQLEDAEFAKTAAIKARQCAEADIQDLSTQLEEAQRAKKEAEDRCARVAKDRAEIQTQLEESEEEVAEVMKKYKSCVSQLSVDQITLSEQSQQIAELEHEKQVLQERMLELSSKVEVLEGETANIHTQRRLEMKIKEIESKLELEQTTRQRLESQIGRLKDQIERLSGDCDAARQKETQALEQSKKIGRQLREAKEDLSALQQRHTDAVNKKGELEKQLELADSEVITLKSDLKLAFKRIEDLQQAIQGDINDSDSDISDSDSDSDGSLSSYLTASLRHQRSSSNSTLRTPPSEVQQLDRMEQPNSPCSEAMSAISEDLDDVSNKESYA